MSSPTSQVLQRLEQSDFETHEGDPAPFGEHLPLVTGVAWEKKTAQLVLVAEAIGDIDVDVWRQFLFAGSGIRFQLSAEHSSAFGTPVAIAIVDDEAEGRLRVLAESLAEDFSIFSRVDLNFVKVGDVGRPEVLDDALAPLLPRCRRLLGAEISRQEVMRFWDLLRREIAKAAAGLDPVFGNYREVAGDYCADVLIGMSADEPELPSPRPIGEISLSRFRSIASLKVKLAAVNVVHGPNGSGKTSLVEAMELAWAGTSERKPTDVSAAEYAEALPQGGFGEFRIVADQEEVDAPSDTARAQLARSVLAHEAIARLAGQSPKERFTGLLEITGLEIPDLKARTAVLLKQAKQDLDRALSEAGLANLPRSNAVALKHYEDEVGSSFSATYDRLPRVEDVQEALVSVSRGKFRGVPRGREQAVRNSLKEADAAVLDALDGRLSEPGIGKILDTSARLVLEFIDERANDLAVSQRLLGQLRDQLRVERSHEEDPRVVDQGLETEAPIGVELATRWLRHSEALRLAAAQFRADAESVHDDRWRTLITAYAENVDRAADSAPVDELGHFARPAPPPRQERTVVVDPEVQRAAGFDGDPIEPELVGPVLRELTDALEAQIAGLRAIAERLERHPVRTLDAHRENLMREMCKFELARTLRREGPILKASETLVTQLLDERLAPVVRELVAAMVRFDWYFKPLKMSTGTRSIVLGGLATDREDLDARLLLNSAEQTVLGLAWFLALHMLQPEEHRQVLVMDDPTAVFDEANTAGFASTLRAFSRLLNPRQIVVATHNDQIAAMLAEELAAVDGWPESVLRLRFRRNDEDESEATEDRAREVERRVEVESERLGLVGDVAA
ncbi:MAG TPA: AAA family ATPase [Solirubrobacterales bacterium]|nr:AAA family ATPase [Solirubrobacterales bacterium]